MWRKIVKQQKYKHRLPASSWVVAGLLLFLVITRTAIVSAAMARNMGAIYLMDDRLPTHLDSAESWLKWSFALSENPAAHRLLGKAWQSRGDVSGAMQEWQSAGLNAFAIDTALQELAQADTKDALVWTQEILMSISTPAEWQRLGSALETRGDYTQAVDAYQQALALLAPGKTDKGSASTAEIYYSLARIYEEKFNDPISATETYSKAVEAGDFQNSWHQVMSYEKLAVLLINNDPERAVISARQAVNLMPERALAHSILGLALYTAYGDFRQAEREIRIAIELDPQSVWPWMHLGQLYFQAKEYQLAADAYLEAAKRNPEFREANDMAVFIRKTYLEK